MGKLLMGLALLVMMTGSIAAAPTWNGNGKGNYVIAIPAKLLPTERKAAEELAHYMGKITGAKISVATETQRQNYGIEQVRE